MDESLIKKAREVAAAALAEWKKKLSASDWKVEQEKVRQKVEFSKCSFAHQMPTKVAIGKGSWEYLHIVLLGWNGNIKIKYIYGEKATASMEIGMRCRRRS